MGWRAHRRKRGLRRIPSDAQVAVMKKRIKQLRKEIMRECHGRGGTKEALRRRLRKDMRKRVRFLTRKAEWKKMREIERVGKSGDMRKMYALLKKESQERCR